MNIVTGTIHAGKTTMLESTNSVFVRWDDWFTLYIASNSGKQCIANIVPAEYLEHPSLTRKLLAITPEMLTEVCVAVSNHFRDFANFAEFVEVPIYAVNAVRREGDIVAVIASPDYDILLERIMSIRKCDADKAAQMIIKSSNELDTIKWDHYISNLQDFNCAFSSRRVA